MPTVRISDTVVPEVFSTYMEKDPTYKYAFWNAGVLRADAGRVLGVTARGKTVSDAAVAAYAAVDRIDWPGGFCRRDIGKQAIAAEKMQ